MKKLLIKLTLLFLATALHAAPKVVVSIQPLHSLVSNLMADVEEPYLLLPAASSPHHFQLRPSDAEQIYEADLIFWVGPELEGFLAKPLKALSDQKHIFTLLEVPNLNLLTLKGHKHHDHEEHTQDHDHNHPSPDPHVWLDPARTQKIVRAMADKLIAIDPTHAHDYQKNLENTLKKLESLEKDLKKDLHSVQPQPFLVFHDGYQYFSDAFKLNNRGPLIDNPHAPFSLHRIKMIKRRLKEEHIICVFGEPDTNVNLIEQLVKDTSAYSGILDPLGVDLAPGPQAYFKMMKALGDDLKSCLEHQGVDKKAEKP